MLLLIITGGILIAFVAAMCGCKAQPRAYLTQEELDDARARKEGERESKIVLHHKKQVEKTERIERETQRNKDLLAFNSARQQALGYTAHNPIMKVEEGFVDPTFVDPSTSLMNVRRKHKPVDAPTRNPLFFPQPPAPQVERQAPGLKKPRPPSFAPSFAPPAAAAPAPVPASAAAPVQVERQAAGLKNPKPPSFLPSPPSKKYEVPPPPSPGDEVLAPTVKKKSANSTNPMSLSSLFSKMNNPNSVLPLHDIGTDTPE
ncbi:hypothetical protein TrRE_jg12266 [Triparma retinervis]|uniref:Uncharacterized protein n=1 Tax=Triparma retinervis TaxID=2557542 RepID=A0A9W7FWJ3_9STRA|nr:hypothetical protein TrRE_jg12266 [Triparma retinervis]